MAAALGLHILLASGRMLYFGPDSEEGTEALYWLSVQP
jgi:hypothetical protein